MAIYIRKSGSEIELKDTKEMVKFAKANGWKKESKEQTEDRSRLRTEQALAELAAAESAAGIN